MGNTGAGDRRGTRTARERRARCRRRHRHRVVAGLCCGDGGQSAARTPGHRLRLRRPGRAAAHRRVDGVAQSSARIAARARAVAMERARTTDDRRTDDKLRFGRHRLDLSVPRPARPGCAADEDTAGVAMMALAVSNIVLWIVVLSLSLVVLALVRQLGVLHERIAPAGALMLNRGLNVGERVPMVDVLDLDGRGLRLGAPRDDGTSTLLPILKSGRKDERDWLEVVLASDGDPDEHRKFATDQGLAGVPYVVSAPLGITYQVSRLPFAALLDAAGIDRKRV